MISLKGLRRRSRCCKADLKNAYADRSKLPIERYDMMECVQCGMKTHKHEVVNEDGVLIWPLDHLPMPPKPQKKPKINEEEGIDPSVDFYKVFLPDGIKLKSLIK